MFLYQVDVAENISIILSQTRTNAKISRREMSELLKVSASTIKAWENGLRSPTLSTIFDWFDIVGEKPYKYMLEFFWPSTFKALCVYSSNEELRKALLVYISEVIGPLEIKKLHFLVMENYDSTWKGVLDLFCALSHTSTSVRSKITEVLHTSFELGKGSRNSSNVELFDDKIRCKDSPTERHIALAHEPRYAVLKEKPKYAKVSSKIMKKARKDAGVSRLYLAKSFGKTERTIQTWESSMEPPFIDVCLWFHIIDRPIWNYLREAIIGGERSEFEEEDIKLKQELYHYASHMKHSELRKLCFLMFWDHDSNWHSLLELMIEYVNTPLSQRVISARLVLMGYEMSLTNALQGKLTGTLPDLENLKSCIEKETQVAKNNAMSIT